MLRLAIVFLIISLIAAMFGFSDVAGKPWIAGKIVFFVFNTLFIVALIAGSAEPRTRV